MSKEIIATAFDYLTSAVIELANVVKNNENGYHIEKIIKEAEQARFLVFGRDEEKEPTSC